MSASQATYQLGIDECQAEPGERQEIAIDGDRRIVLQDCIGADPRTYRLTYQGSFIKGRYHLVEARLYEGISFHLLDVTDGTWHTPADEPIYSADSTFFVSANLDLLGMGGANRLEIWRLTSSGPIIEFSLDGNDVSGPSSPRWDSAGQIGFWKVRLDPRSSALDSVEQTVRRDAAGQWQLLNGRP